MALLENIAATMPQYKWPSISLFTLLIYITICYVCAKHTLIVDFNNGLKFYLNDIIHLVRVSNVYTLWFILTIVVIKLSNEQKILIFTPDSMSIVHYKQLRACVLHNFTKR
jgi:hypothetical protein